MVTMKELLLSKYAQDWYRPKIISKIWSRCYAFPVIVIKYAKAAKSTNWHTYEDPEMRYLYSLLCWCGRKETVEKLLEMEEDILSNIVSRDSQ